MRVVAGEAKGRRIVAPEGNDTRPTLDRVREAMFNSLGSLDAIEDAKVVDLFAGSGALGIEALSRGANSCVFVESGRAARKVIEGNLATTGLADRATVVVSTVEAWLREKAAAPGDNQFDLVLLDPPYGTSDEVWVSLLSEVERIATNGVVVIESDRSIPLPIGWDAQKEKRYGGTLVSVIFPPDNPEPV